MTIETARLVIRPFVAEDAPEACRQSREAQMRRFLPDQVYRSSDEAVDILLTLRRRSLTAQSPKYPFVLAITRKVTGEYIGHVGLSVIEEGIEIGYGLGSAYRGIGYAREAVAAFLRVMMPKFELKSIYGVVDEENQPSINTLESIGFVLLREEENGKRIRRVYRYEVPEDLEEWEQNEPEA